MKAITRLLLGLLLMSQACQLIEPDKTLTLEVADHRVDCVGVAPQKCLLIKTPEDKTYTFWYESIKGFNYEEGFVYRLKVRKVKVRNPPADAASFYYQLLEVLEKKKP